MVVLAVGITLVFVKCGVLGSLLNESRQRRKKKKIEEREGRKKKKLA